MKTGQSRDIKVDSTWIITGNGSIKVKTLTVTGPATSVSHEPQLEIQEGEDSDKSSNMQPTET